MNRDILNPDCNTSAYYFRTESFSENRTKETLVLVHMVIGWLASVTKLVLSIKSGWPSAMLKEWNLDKNGEMIFGATAPSESFSHFLSKFHSEGVARGRE